MRDAELAAAELGSDSEEIKSRAATGVFMLGGRTIVVRAIGLLSNVILARLLLPEDFGIVALGYALIGVGMLFSDAGIGLGVIRRAEPPTTAEMRSIVGFQLVTSAAMAAAAVAASLLIGGGALITAVMMLSLPILALRTPGLLFLDRQLDYRVRVKVEVLEVATSFVWSIALAALGFGAWSLATAVVLRAVVGAGAVIRLTPTGFIAPRLALAPVRGLLAFGARFQALSLLQMIAGVAFTAGIAGVGGLTALGFWALTQRLMQIPMMLFEVIWSLTVPTFSRLVHGGDDDVGEIVGRAMTVLAIVAGALLATLAGSAPALVPLVFGETWTDSALILPGACMALIVSGPTNIVLMALLYAHGDASTPLRGAIAHWVVRLPASLIGLHYFGVVGLGAGWLLAQLVELPFVIPAAHRAAGAPLARRVIAPTIACAIAAGVAWAIAEAAGAGVLALVLALVTAPAVFFGLMSAIDWDAVRATAHTVKRVTQIARTRLATGVTVP